MSLDLQRATLQLDGETVTLRPQSFEVLRILAENTGNMVGKRDLIDSVWGDVAVTDDSLTQCLADIRRALSDTDKKIVRTIPRRGYVLEGDLLAPDDRENPHSLSRFSKPAGAAVFLLMVVLVWHFASNIAINRSNMASPSIAVLPFVDMTEAQDQKHLGDGVSEELRNILAKTPELRVIARTSSFAISNTGADIEEIGRRLGVSHVLEGGVRQGGDRLRITAQLISTSDSSHLWSETFERSAGDILDIQTSIARAVAAELHVALELPDSTYGGATDPYAYALMIQARSLLNSPGMQINREAQQLLRRAIELDPDYSMAYSMLARAVFRSRRQGTTEEDDEIWRESMALTTKAYQLDPHNPIANAQQGWLALHYFHDLHGAARFYERAQSLDSQNPDIVAPIINASVIFNQPDAGVELGRWLVERDPLCLNCYSQTGLAARVAGDTDLAIRVNRRILELIPDAPNAYQNLGRSLLWSGDPEGALEAFSRHPTESAMDIAYQAIASHQMGNIDEFERLKARLMHTYADTNPTAAAQLEAYSGNIDSAFEWLDRQMAQPPHKRGFSYQSPYYENLHNDPRWQTYLDAVGVSEKQLADIGFTIRLPGTL